MSRDEVCVEDSDTRLVEVRWRQESQRLRTESADGCATTAVRTSNRTQSLERETPLPDGRGSVLSALLNPLRATVYRDHALDRSPTYQGPSRKVKGRRHAQYW
jgi:hypothetical protein